MSLDFAPAVKLSRQTTLPTSDRSSLSPSPITDGLSSPELENLPNALSVTESSMTSEVAMAPSGALTTDSDLGGGADLAATEEAKLGLRWMESVGAANFLEVMRPLTGNWQHHPDFMIDFIDHLIHKEGGDREDHIERGFVMLTLMLQQLTSRYLFLMGRSVEVSDCLKHPMRAPLDETSMLLRQLEVVQHLTRTVSTLSRDSANCAQALLDYRSQREQSRRVAKRRRKPVPKPE